MTEDQGSHLFISYASEDGDHAEWLTLKLIAEGYEVWCDRVKLLGGESYPRDIDDAIKRRTFRLLHLLSRSSQDKPNPAKERTLALNIGRERHIDFLIPLNVDGLRAVELNWMTSDLTFIPFDESWAVGFAALLKKLRAINAPRPVAGTGLQQIANWYQAQDLPDTRDELLLSNRLEVTGIPSTVHRLSIDGPRPDWPAAWPVFEESTRVLWTFALPPEYTQLEEASLSTVDWVNRAAGDGPNPVHVATYLLRQHLRQHCLLQGLKETDRGQLYFPPGLIPGDRLPYRAASGRMTGVLCTGVRTFRSAIGERRTARYALAPRFWIVRLPPSGFLVEVQVRVVVMHEDGTPLDPVVAQRRRKRITKAWFNHQWRTRLLAVLNWLGHGSDEIQLGAGTGVAIMLRTQPETFHVSVGIDEEALTLRKGHGQIEEHEEGEENDDLPDADVEDGVDFS